MVGATKMAALALAAVLALSGRTRLVIEKALTQSGNTSGRSQTPGRFTAAEREITPRPGRRESRRERAWTNLNTTARGDADH